MSTTENIPWSELTVELHRFVARRLGADVDDVVQDTLLKIHKHLPELRDTELLSAWAYRIARRAIIDKYRARDQLAKREQRHDESVTDMASGEAELLPDDEDLNAEVASWLAPMIRRLPEPYREALELTELQGVSQAELARRAGLSRSGARTRVQRGRAKLRDVVERCCDVTTDRRGNVIDYEPKGGCC